MIKVKFTSALKRFFPQLTEEEIKANSVKELLEILEGKYPGIKEYILDGEDGLRKHVNIFLDEDLISDRKGLSDSLSKRKELLIYQALSGG